MDAVQLYNLFKQQSFPVRSICGTAGPTIFSRENSLLLACRSLTLETRQTMLRKVYGAVL